MATATLPKSKAPKATATSTPKASVAPVAPDVTPTPTPPASAPAPSSARRGRDVRRKADLLKMVAEATRLQILTILAGADLHVGGLCARVGQSQPAVSHHLALCRHGGLIEARRDGKNSVYSLTELGMKLFAAIKTLDE